MITLTITLKTFMIIIASISIYITINLWVLNYFNNKLASKLMYNDMYSHINFNTNRLKYMFFSIFLLFKKSDVIKNAIYENNCNRLKMLKDMIFIFPGDVYDLERSNLEKEIYKYEMYIKLKSLKKKKLFNIKI